ncbi:PilN domain-containing protein [Desulfosporosinus nitroreducens]|uniref:PilN domain-containing protein n=1 Tax=Desulfosporosinus nitroreducens TaxID=2018668 RepID=UPI00207C57A6|nr:PilN domain-containing protein [Desulfosporosinus nitroreducens]MCO1600088.1 PilN domain-containing protein [Desulfosporosinus nitroreducens]
MREKREFNFAKRWLEGLARENGSPSKWKERALLWGTGSILILIVAGSIPWLWEYKVKRDIALVEKQIIAIEKINNQVNQLKGLKVQAQEQQQLLDLMQKSSQDPGPILEKLMENFPIGTVINSFSLQENTLTMGVSVPIPVDVARLWVSLRDSGMFQEVDIQTVSLEDKAQTLNFNLKLRQNQDFDLQTMKSKEQEG